MKGVPKVHESAAARLAVEVASTAEGDHRADRSASSFHPSQPQHDRESIVLRLPSNTPTSCSQSLRGVREPRDHEAQVCMRSASSAWSADEPQSERLYAPLV